MHIPEFVEGWISAANRYETTEYLSYYWPDAILDDPSVGSTFTGHSGIKDYFVTYFIGYSTKTSITQLVIKDEEHAYLEVAFVGDFPEGNIRGTFDFTFKKGKIAFLKADLIH